MPQPPQIDPPGNWSPVYEARNAQGTVVALIRFLDELPHVDWLTLRGRSFFWVAGDAAFVEVE
jgi:hypothetical protein